MIRRTVIALAILIALAAGAVVAGDLVAVHFTESAIAKRIEQRVPGSHAKVTISSSPFLYHLAAAGTVERLEARVTGVEQGGYAFQSIDVTVDGLQVSRSSLLRGSVHLKRISSATIVAVLSRDQLVQAGAAALEQLGVPGTTVQGTVTAGTGKVTISMDGVSFTVPYGSLVPCVGTAAYTGASLVLSCTTHTLPPALADQAT